MNWLSKLFKAPDKRKSRRLIAPPLMAFYWDGGLSAPHAVPDISHTGIFLKTADRWFPRTLIRVTLQKKSDDPEESEETITVQCRVVRTGEDGVGMAIMLAEEDRSDYPAALGSLATRKQLSKFLEQLRPDETETSIPESPYLPFPKLTLMTDPASPGDRTAARDPKKEK